MNDDLPHLTDKERKIAARAEAVPPGPLELSRNGRYIWRTESSVGLIVCCDGKPDAQFYLYAREDVLGLLSAISDLRGKLEALVKAGVTDYSTFTGSNRVDCHFCNGIWRPGGEPKHKPGCPLARILAGRTSRPQLE